MNGGYAVQFRIDLGNKRAELQLLGELSGIEVSNYARLNFSRVNLRVLDRLFAGLNNDVPDGFAFLLQVALKIRAPSAENENFVHNIINLAVLPTLSSRTNVRDLTKNFRAFRTPGGLPQRIDVARRSYLGNNSRVGEILRGLRGSG